MYNCYLCVVYTHTESPDGQRYYIQPLLASIVSSVVAERVFYILTLAWGFRRCSFRLVGQCESLYSVERVTEQAPRFFVCING